MVFDLDTGLDPQPGAVAWQLSPAERALDQVLKATHQLPPKQSEPCWIRTNDPLLKRQMLCHLS